MIRSPYIALSESSSFAISRAGRRRRRGFMEAPKPVVVVAVGIAERMASIARAHSRGALVARALSTRGARFVTTTTARVRQDSTTGDANAEDERGTRGFRARRTARARETIARRCTTSSWRKSHERAREI